MHNKEFQLAERIRISLQLACAVIHNYGNTSNTNIIHFRGLYDLIPFLDVLDFTYPLKNSFESFDYAPQVDVSVEEKDYNIDKPSAEGRHQPRRRNK